jgi:hypothetical protein
MKRLAVKLTAAIACTLWFTVVSAASGPRPASGIVPQMEPLQQGRGRGAGGPPPPPRAGAPVDLVGNWVAIVTEDWMWRMRTPPKGDVTSVPLNGEGRKVAESWDPSLDGKCEAYGVGGLMRMPTRLRISWENDTTLKIETDAGQQTRMLYFGEPPASAAGTLQGVSRAEWIRSGGAFDAFLERGTGPAPQRWGQLRVTTRNMKAGWLRRNGVPYSENAVITENFIRISPPGAGEWFVVSTTVDDPKYLAQPFVTSSNFKKEADGSKWAPAPCRP